MLPIAEKMACRRGMLLSGRYRLRRLLNESGMSWIWLAQDEALDIPVVVKIVKSDGQQGADMAAEGRLLARLRHPSIVAVIDCGRTPHGDHFLVMEHLAGNPLSSVLERDRRLPARAAVELMLPILDALSFCHGQGVVHRDVTPANIFFVREQSCTRPKLLDFGVATVLGTQSALPELVGTPGYMAPEQLQGKQADHRTDIWACCAVLYEAVAGRPAIVADTWQALLVANAQCKVTPLPANREQAALWPILERGLHKHPAERFTSADELRHSLVCWLREAPARFPRHGDAPW